ncbi:unnamed protein product [Closterium sp. Naga37s-1]|nr:unnamed protein product [Closterium sp. Naga37s-1]
MGLMGFAACQHLGGSSTPSHTLLTIPLSTLLPPPCLQPNSKAAHGSCPSLTTPLFTPLSPPPFPRPQGSAGQCTWGEFSCHPAGFLSPLPSPPPLTTPDPSCPHPPDSPITAGQRMAVDVGRACHSPFSPVPFTTSHRSPSLCSARRATRGSGRGRVQLPACCSSITPFTPNQTAIPVALYPNLTAGQRMAVDVGRVQLPACAVDRCFINVADVHLSACVGRAAVSLKALAALLTHRNHSPHL